MSGRDLYRSALRGGYIDSPNTTHEMSPMSNLAHTLLGTSLSRTPRKRLSLSSNMSDTPDHNNSRLHDNHSSDSSSSSIEDTSFSPRRLPLSRDKENFPSPYYSPSRSVPTPPQRSRASPLQEVQNTVNRNLSFSPRKKNLQMVSPSKRVFLSPQKPSPPDDFDTTSQDSGYSESGKKVDDTCFSVPVSCAPRKLNLDLSPPKLKVSPVKPSTISSIFTAASSTPLSSTSSEASRPFRKFSLVLKGDEDDAMLRDLMDEETALDGPPMGLSSLLSAPIQVSCAPRSNESTPIPQSRPSIRRCLSMLDTTPTTSRVQCVTSTEISSSSTFKRPDPPTSSPTDCKRRKLDEPCEQLSPLTSNAATTTGIEKVRSALTLRQVSAPECPSSPIAKPKFMRSHSESHLSIMKALNKSTGHTDFIGDFSKPWVLPTLESGKHPDLKSISVDTLAEVLKGKYSHSVASYRIIDCRYPYEFQGGHIHGAEMWHHPEKVGENLKAQKGAPVIQSEENLRNILIFHCEFSAERGPKAQRLLREMDRTANKEHYPALHFPEMYLLEGGYKAFFESYPTLCTPNNYVRMLDANHTEDLKHFRGKSKSWAAENKQSKNRNALPRPGLKRLGL